MQSSTTTMQEKIATLISLDRVELMTNVAELMMELENEKMEHKKTFTKYQDCDMNLCKAENNMRQNRHVIRYHKEQMKALLQHIDSIDEQRQRDSKDDYRVIDNLKRSLIGKQMDIEKLEILVKSYRPDSKDERIKELEAEVKKLKIGGPIQDQARFKILTDDNNELGRQVVDLRSLYVDAVEREESVKQGYRAQIMELRAQLGQVTGVLPMAPYSPRPVFFEPMPVQMIHYRPPYASAPMPFQNPQQMAPAVFEPQGGVQSAKYVHGASTEPSQSPPQISTESESSVYPQDLPQYTPEDYQRFADMHAAKMSRKNPLAQEMKNLKVMLGQEKKEEANKEN